jgi:hypothetical protein
MIQVEPCKGCGAIILLGELMGLRAKCDPTPVDAQEAVAALLAGRELHRVTYVGDRPANLSPARPAVLSALLGAEPPMVVQEHRCRADARQGGCTPAGRPNAPMVVSAYPKAPERPAQSPVGPSTPSSALSTAHPGVHAAAQRDSDRCSTCHLPAPLDVRDRLVIAQLGATVIDITHRTCP